MCQRVLLLCVALVIGGEGAVNNKPPPSPCPSVFRYQFEQGQWTGHITALVPNRAKGMKVVVSLYVTSVLPPEFPGGLYLTKDKDVVKEDILLGGKRTIDYQLIFPVQHPMPVIDRIQVNEQNVCSGPRVRNAITKTSFRNSLEFTRPSHNEKDNELFDLQLGYQKEIINKSRDLGKKYKSLPKDDKILRKNHEQLNPKFETSPSPSYSQSPNFLKGKNNPQKDAELLSEEFFPENSPGIEFSISNNDHDSKTNIPTQGFNPKDEVEMLNGIALPEINLHPKSSDRDFNNGKSDVSTIEFNPKDDAEIFDSKLLKKKFPEFTVIPPKSNVGTSGVLKGEFSPKNDAELLSSELFKKKGTEIIMMPPKINHGIFHVSENEFNPKDDVEILNGALPLEKVPIVKLIPPKRPGRTFNGGKSDNPKKDFNPKDDAELLNSGILQKKAPEFKLILPKRPGLDFKNSKSDLPKNQFNPKTDAEILKTGIFHEKGPETKLKSPKIQDDKIKPPKNVFNKQNYVGMRDKEMLDYQYINFKSKKMLNDKNQNDFK